MVRYGFAGVCDEDLPVLDLPRQVKPRVRRFYCVLEVIACLAEAPQNGYAVCPRDHRPARGTRLCGCGNSNPDMD